jgi:hypothetical protein
VRHVTLEDIDRILEIERSRWRDQAATREMIVSRIREFPEGQLAAIHVTAVNGEPVRRTLVAWSTVMPADEAGLRALGSWEQVTGNGTIENLDRTGNALVGVNLTSVTEGATYILVGEILASVVEWEKKCLIGGSRLNGYSAFNERRASERKSLFTADQYARLREIRGYRMNEERFEAGRAPLSDKKYVELVSVQRSERGEGQLSDDDLPDYVCSNIRGYMGLPGTRMIGVIPNYFSDAASADYGVVIEWPNPLPVPLRRVGVLKRWLAARVRSAVRAELDTRQLRVRERSRRRTEERIPEFLRRDGLAEAPAEVTSEPQIEVSAGERGPARPRPPEPSKDR